jgi:hypothetical protein
MAYEADVVYSARLNKGQLELAKFVDGDKQPHDIYFIADNGRGKCSCFQGFKGLMCKHKQLAEIWHTTLKRDNLPRSGSFYDYDHSLLYHPDDGEGIPTSGCVDVLALYQEQLSAPQPIKPRPSMYAQQPQPFQKQQPIEDKTYDLRNIQTR